MAVVSPTEGRAARFATRVTATRAPYTLHTSASPRSKGIANRERTEVGRPGGAADAPRRGWPVGAWSAWAPPPPRPWPVARARAPPRRRGSPSRHATAWNGTCNRLHAVACRRAARLSSWWSRATTCSLLGGRDDDVERLAPLRTIGRHSPASRGRGVTHEGVEEEVRTRRAPRASASEAREQRSAAARARLAVSRRVTMTAVAGPFCAMAVSPCVTMADAGEAGAIPHRCARDAAAGADGIDGSMVACGTTTTTRRRRRGGERRRNGPRWRTVHTHQHPRGAHCMAPRRPVEGVVVLPPAGIGWT